MLSNTQGHCSYCTRPYYYSDYVPFDESNVMNYDPSNPYELTELKCSHIFHSRCLVNYGKESCPECNGVQFSHYSQNETPILLEYILENFNLDEEEVDGEGVTFNEHRPTIESPSQQYEIQQSSNAINPVNNPEDEEESSENLSCEPSNFEITRNLFIENNWNENQTPVIEGLLITYDRRELEEMAEEANRYTDAIATKIQTALAKVLKINNEYRSLLDKIQAAYEKLELSLSEQPPEGNRLLHLDSILKNAMHFLKQLPEFHFEYNTCEVVNELEEVQSDFLYFLFQLETVYRLESRGEISSNVRSSIDSLRELAKNIRFGWGK